MVLLQLHIKLNFPPFVFIVIERYFHLHLYVYQSVFLSTRAMRGIPNVEQPLSAISSTDCGLLLLPLAACSLQLGSTVAVV